MPQTAVSDTFQAFADAVIPRSQQLAQQYGRIQYFGALDAGTDEYLAMSLDRLFIPLAVPAAEVLNLAAEQYIFKAVDREKHPPAVAWTFFARLTPIERLEAVDALLVSDVSAFPEPVQASGEVLYPVLLSLNRLMTMGYYSEWSGYGTTRLGPPDARVLEHRPIGWEQIGYPGPSRGYNIPRA